MKAVKIIAILLIAAGVLGLIYRSFSYTKETHTTNLGPIDFSIKEKEKVNIPVWASVGVIVIGVGLLLLKNKKD